MENLIYLLLICVLAYILFILLFKSKTNVKDQAVKKEELVAAYKKQMQDLLTNYEYNKQLQTQEKIKLLKKINHELSMNIFFEENESKELLNQLANMS